MKPMKQPTTRSQTRKMLPKPKIYLAFQAGSWEDVSGLKTLCEETITRTLAVKPILMKKDIHIDVTFTDDAQIQILNHQYRGKNNPTNVLSFPQHDPLEEDLKRMNPTLPLLLGDVVLSYETVTKEAQDQKKAFSHHLTHLLVHGVLHLLGFNHINEEDAHEMETLEIKILQDLNVPNPYGREVLS